MLRSSKPAVHRSAVIDIGSNSVRLVVYEGPARAPAVIFNEKVAAGLGRGLAIDGRIASEDAMRGLMALRRYALLAKHMEVQNLQCVATAAVRDAENGPEFIASAAEAGLKIRLLSGEEEAEAAGYGVVSAIPDAHGIAVDLGGGSLELAEVANGQVGRRASFPLGVLRLPALRKQGQQPFERAVRKMLRAAGWPDGMTGLPLYLVGGSWRALSRLDLELTHDPLAVLDQHSLPRSALRRLVRATNRLTFEELRAIPGMASNRAAALPDAAALLAALVNILDVPEMTVSSSGLREGLLYQALDAETRAQDPLIVAAEFEGRRLARFAPHGRAITEWITPLFTGEAPADNRVRLAASLLSDVAWSANPDFRAERGTEIGLHGNWRGIDIPGRILLARALHAGFGGADGDFPDMGPLVSAERLARARQWGLAIRLAQRLTGGVEAPLKASHIALVDGKLRLSLDHGWHHLAGESVERRLKSLAQALDAKAELVML
ncbi:MULTISPECIES: Ppx/GppA family phosphatase [unclassified Sphingopyxis]|uniref:Ppx/GppA family phosphatase n=1 Tax=unclassified Sphingopyxis TaxID=2614943 RepID=UPI00285FFC59|nr:MULTISPECIES: Ppx/GppA family phosphatase [unclassified Sphingopyxis]MDR6832253.1 exopolyphosphatase/guanosine-5'-triphosphate,3'-diphosphate pyrophosphatase [Sphingopyxis sp. BE122]MDR7227996.1 exopolyphosphatase/guanosine-5'-triphosphate,3'-diphosphate pyrophosphatase [Sphingopyxis sp. BE259]